MDVNKMQQAGARFDDKQLASLMFGKHPSVGKRLARHAARRKEANA